MSGPADPRRALDEVDQIDSEALMREVRIEVERRRAAGEYPSSLDDVPPFEDLGLEDDLVASVHRLEGLSRIPGVTPVLPEVGGGAARLPTGLPAGHAPTTMLDRGLVAARAVARRVVGPRLENVVRQGAEYLMASAHHSRLVVARILDVERRLRALEERDGRG
jgi:hypothetical protein